MTTKRPYLLSIAGFDPSAGAGILADIKTFEAHGTYGFGVSTGLTFQNDTEFIGVNWHSDAEITQQIAVICRRFKLDIVKIGLIQNLNTLKEIIDFLQLINPDIRIVWDPILSATAGFTFHEAVTKKEFLDLSKKLFLITPNLIEGEKLFTTINPKEIQEIIQNTKTSVLLKGGHSENDECIDWVIQKDAIIKLDATKIEGFTKHGTGCVLSSAIAANLAKGIALPQACLNAKYYIENFIISNNTNLGYHFTNNG